ncbi:DUF1738 domain-containing protein [Rhodospirillaceae bacterium KN72]|uniref:DUF1738 domain-containing protein n=1 Tax=Pacificispira spongiicola TaxID=2729598 RepID=A0A7Y0DYG3_9PROT|nr:zincin-like metallopeptidase domain-containing protein [Pacificispira spongiicola]NMM43915.1 DUF1738 domain-containing protein [Pacificispira spongiicola]
MATDTRKPFRETVAEEFTRLIEQGEASWQKPWEPNVGISAPFNPISNKPYRGINAWWLELQGWVDPRWLTYRQAQELGGQVRKGERSTSVEYWKWTERSALLDGDGRPVLDEAGKPQTVEYRLERPQVFYANVFNGDQIDGIEPFQAPPIRFEPVEEAERVLAAGGVDIRHDQADRAFYTPREDRIHLPHKAAFPSAYEYYATALHELGHASGHESRLAREFGPFGSETYAIEELRAEMSAYMVGRDLSLGHYPERHAGYVGSWLKAIKEDRNVLFRAARDAEIIRSWVMEPERRQELERIAQQGRTQSPQQEQAMQTAEPESKTRHFLTVPFEEKEAAKAAGAKWDKRAKSWYAPDGADLDQLARWVTPSDKARNEVDPVAEFTIFLQDAGLQIDGAPQMDGDWHRVSVEGDKPGQKSGSYRGFLDGAPNGQAMNFKTGEKSLKWVATGNTLSKEEIDRARRAVEERRVERERELQERQELAATWSDVQWRTASERGAPSPEHPYLLAKGVAAHGLLEDATGQLMVPLRDAAGKTWNIQRISPEGEKRFLKGGRKAGLYHVIGEIDAKGPVVIGEGYSTAATIHEATGYPVVVAFDAGNLRPVAETIRETYPEARIFVAADDDHAKDRNAGLRKGEEAAKAVGGIAVNPGLTPAEREAGMTDFNDKARSAGKAVVKDIFDAVIGRPRSGSPERNAGERKTAGRAQSLAM